MEIARKIRESRERKRMTQKELAEKIRITTKTLQNYENGSTKPNKAILDEILKILEIRETNEKEQEQENELLRYFRKLNEIEKEFYIADMKTRILKKEIE
ncbi:hypothetical protein CINF_1227 [Candidatus Campylobacter infans]|uniref:HTH cro/C1-type domain-containing protein n=1 Tax=Candidatus Campylobacter infans TaxID=2561898 RepID=A0A7H9CN97_9BACT|nr:helix-turn-helix transcriptional regulator [Candidatus Campylobacter infans]QLI05714.1 hypothetical protein CINF_1227 [Candidatus Campylobacter infans]